MSGHDDDLPDYLKGVEPAPGFDDRDNHTVRPDREGPIGRQPAPKPVVDDDDDDDEHEPREPLRVPVGLIAVVFAVFITLGLFGAASVGAMATWVTDAEREALAAGGSLARVVDDERKIIDELGSRGGNRAELMAAYAAIDGGAGHERGMRALAFTRLVEQQMVAIGDVRGTPLDDRQKKLTIAQRQYEAAMASWRSAAGNPLGRLACGVGLAPAPP